MDDCIIRIPKSHLNAETVAVARLLATVFVLIHRVIQVISANKDLNYPSLEHYRKAASHRITYHRTLLKCAIYFKDALTIMQNEVLETMVQTISPASPLRRGPL